MDSWMYRERACLLKPFLYQRLAYNASELWPWRELDLSPSRLTFIFDAHLWLIWRPWYCYCFIRNLFFWAISTRADYLHRYRLNIWLCALSSKTLCDE